MKTSLTFKTGSVQNCAFILEVILIFMIVIVPGPQKSTLLAAVIDMIEL